MSSSYNLLTVGGLLTTCVTPSAVHRGRVLWGSVSLAVVCLLLCLPSLGDWCWLTPDSFGYLTIARTLAEAGDSSLPRMMAPPGYPAIIAPLLASGDAPFGALRALFSIGWAATAVLTFLLHRRELGDGLGWLAGLMVAGSPVLLELTTTPISEPVFLPIAAALLVVMNRWWHRPVSRWSEVALGGLLTTAAFMVRSMGLVLLPLMALALLRHRSQALGRRLLWAGLFAACTLGPWNAWQHWQRGLPPGPSYGYTWTTARGAEETSDTGLTLQVERFKRFAPLRLRAVKEAMVPKDLAWRVFNPPLDVPTTWLVGGAFMAIAAVRVVRYRSLPDAYVLLTMGVLALWPWDEGVRFVAPLIPVLVAYPLWLGLICWRRRGARQWERYTVAAALVCLLTVQAGGMVLSQGKMVARRDKAQRRFAEMSELSRWHESNTPYGATWIGVAPNLHNSKLLLLGAAYLSRRPVTTIDVRDGEPVTLPETGASTVFVHDSLYESVNAGISQTSDPVEKLGEFIVFRTRPGSR